MYSLYYIKLFSLQLQKNALLTLCNDRILQDVVSMPLHFLLSVSKNYRSVYIAFKIYFHFKKKVLNLGNPGWFIVQFRIWITLCKEFCEFKPTMWFFCLFKETTGS